MASSGTRFVSCLFAVLLASGFADDQVKNDLETKETNTIANTQNSEGSRSGAYYASEEDSHSEHLDSNKQLLNEAYSDIAGAANLYSYADQKKAYENSQHHASQYQQSNQQRRYVPGQVPTGPVRVPIPGLQVPNVLSSGYKYQQSNEESMKQQNQYNYNQKGNYNKPGHAVDVITRPIPYTDYYWPHRQPGYENTIICKREGELHSFWTPNYDCMVCTCVRERALEPVCVSCAACSNQKTFPAPVPITSRPPPTIEPTTEVISEPVPEIVTCSPMPSGTPFQNPLHPCQICICYESVNVYGVPDVKIECQENPQCVLPPEPVPYVPDQPLPLPQCEKFPNNVLFPHPVEACKVCKCTVQVTPNGPKDHITCFPDPDCETPVTVYPVPSEPLIVPVTEAVWSPVTPRVNPVPVPGPLPGPSPHESCRPYLPNQPFQHPWDECQTCVCTESHNVGVVTIEVNCYTKKICCIENPLEQTIAPSPYIPTPTPVYPYNVPGYLPGGAQSLSSESELQAQEEPKYSHVKQYQQYGAQVPLQYLQPGYNKLILNKPGYGYVPSYGQKYYDYGQSPYSPVTYGQGSYGQSTAYDKNEHYDKSLNYNQKAYKQELGVNYGQGAYATGAYGQNLAYDENEHYDKSLNYAQNAYAQGQGVNYGQGAYSAGAYGESLAYDENEHHDKSLNYAQNAYAQGQGVNYGQGAYAAGAYGQSLAYDENEHHDKSLNYAQNAYAQGQGVKYGQGAYAAGAYGQSLAYDENEHHDKSLNYAQKAYGKGQGVNYGQGANIAGAYGQSLAYDENEHHDKRLNYAQNAYAQGQGVNYGQGAYSAGAYGQSLAYNENENHDKSLNYAQKAYGQGQVNYGQGVYGQSPVNAQLLGVAPVKLSTKARTKSADPSKYEASNELK